MVCVVIFFALCVKQAAVKMIFVLDQEKATYIARKSLLSCCMISLCNNRSGGQAIDMSTHTQSYKCAQNII